MAYYGKKLQNLCSCSFFKLSYFCRSTLIFLLSIYRYTLLILNPLTIHLLYFFSLSTLGFLLLKVSKTETKSFEPRNLDLFFTSVSASTVSSMSTVEMEVFSNSQLIVLTILMFVGGEVFTSMVGLHLGRLKLRKLQKNQNKVSCTSIVSTTSNFLYQIELGIVDKNDSEMSVSGFELSPQIDSIDREYWRYKSIKFLSFLVLGYLVISHVAGVSLVLVYFSLVSSAKNVLKTKGLKLSTFSIFTIVSTFASCGFVPTNENMIIFRKNSGLLWILIPQVLLGNTLFPPFLRFSVWLIGKFTRKNETNFLLKNSEEIGYHHFLPRLHSMLLVATVVGFIIVQFVLVCSMEWNSTTLNGMNSYEKFVGIIFLTVNTRHTGETIVDLSTMAQAVLVLFVVMMYFPPYTSFLPLKQEDERYPSDCEQTRKRRQTLMENFIFSQLSYLVIFIILICITERKRMEDDPLNFNVLNIIVEVISAYGNVGFSTGYSCERLLKPDSNCKDKWYGFAGRWSDEGKVILIFIMIFGRLKKFNMDGGKAWKLL